MSDIADPLGADLRRAVTRLYSRFRSERLEGEVPDAALLVLIVLDKNGPLTLSDLAAAAHVTLGSMGQTVRWLERSAYLVKSRGVEDRRTVLHALTDAGREASAASRRHRHDWLEGRLADFTDAERADLARAAALLIRLADS